MNANIITLVGTENKDAFDIVINFLYQMYRYDRRILRKQVGTPTKARAGFIKMGCLQEWEASVGFVFRR